MRTRLACFVAWLGAAGCLSVAYFNRTRQVVEGAYFDDDAAGTAVGREGGSWTSYAPLRDGEYSVFSPFDIWNAYLWLGMGIALALAATLLWLVAWRRAP